MILRAGASRDPTYIPLLKQVIDAWAAGGSSNSMSYRPNGGHTYVALYSLWLIGGSEDYFRTNLHNWKEDYNLAHLSAQMLALNPTPEFIEELERVCEVSSNPNGSNYLWGDLSRAKGVAYATRTYEALPNDAARARFVVDRVAGYWTPYLPEHFRINPTGSGWTTIDYNNLKSVVAWGWFQTLIREQPALIADAIRSVSIQIIDLQLGARRDITPEEKERIQAWLNDIVNQ